MKTKAGRPRRHCKQRYTEEGGKEGEARETNLENANSLLRIHSNDDMQFTNASKLIRFREGNPGPSSQISPSKTITTRGEREKERDGKSREKKRAK